MLLLRDFLLCWIFHSFNFQFLSRERPPVPPSSFLLTLTWDNGVPVQEQGDPQQHEDTKGQDVRPPSAPRRSTVVAGWADDGLEQEAQDGTDQPNQAVQASRKTHAQKYRCDKRGLHGVAEFPSKHDRAVEDESTPRALWGLIVLVDDTLPAGHVFLFGAGVAHWELMQRVADVFARLRKPAGLGSGRLVLWQKGHGWERGERGVKGEREKERENDTGAKRRFW